MENIPLGTETQDTTVHDEPEQLAFPVLPADNSEVAARSSRWEQVLEKVVEYNNEPTPANNPQTTIERSSRNKGIEKMAEDIGRNGGLPALDKAVENYQKQGRYSLANGLLSTIAYRSFFKDQS